MSVVVLVAPAAFKSSFGPRQVADALSAGLRRALPEASLLQCPISDGGDGLLDAVLAAGALREQVSVTGPLGAPVAGVLGWVDPETAIFESATACGIALLRPDQLDALRTTTRGVGELIWEAGERGAMVGRSSGPFPVAVPPAGSARASRSSPRPGWCREPRGCWNALASTPHLPRRISSSPAKAPSTGRRSRARPRGRWSGARRPRRSASPWWRGKS